MRPKLTYSNLVSTICLFLLLGGGAFAASHLPKNSVGPKQLRKNSVTTAKLRKGAVTAAKVKKGALTGNQIKASTLGKVPAAANADAVGGVGLDGLLRSDHLLTGSATAEGQSVLRDPRTGLEVQFGPAGRLRLLNTNTQDAIFGEGVEDDPSSVETHKRSIDLGPGEHIDLATGPIFVYGQYIFEREPSGVPLQLTCILHEPGQPAKQKVSCVAVG